MYPSPSNTAGGCYLPKSEPPEGCVAASAFRRGPGPLNWSYVARWHTVLSELQSVSRVEQVSRETSSVHMGHLS